MNTDNEFYTTLAPQDTSGWHMRPAGLLVSIANMFESEIMIKCGRRMASAKSLLGILTLGAGKGARLYVSARGRDAQNAINAITEKFSPVSSASKSDSFAPVPPSLRAVKPKQNKAITFRLRTVSNVKKVFLVGDFNGWDTQADPMNKRGGQFSKSLKLPPGKYQYKYIVDGEWHTDPAVPVVTSNVGSINNVINI